MRDCHDDDYAGRAGMWHKPYNHKTPNIYVSLVKT